MKKIKIIAIIFLISFSANAQENLYLNSTIKSVFNEAEIKDLELIMEFFEERICSSKILDKKSEIDCYKIFINRALYLAKKGEIITFVPLFKQKELYSKINSSTFDEIWNYGYSWRPKSPDTLKEIDFNNKGKYSEYLKRLSKDSEVINGYYESFLIAGASSPSLRFFLLHQKHYNIEDIRLRLVIAISYLTINDYAQRNEKY